MLDLGCGAGRDVYIASQLVGPTGKVRRMQEHYYYVKEATNILRLTNDM